MTAESVSRWDTLGSEDQDLFRDPSELNLDQEWLRQAQILADLFAEELDMSKEEYVYNLPPFPEKRPEFRDTSNLDIPLIVQPPQPDLPIERLLDIIGILHWNPIRGHIQDWKGDRARFRTPQRPYATWCADPYTLALPGSSVRQVRSRLLSYERAGGYEGIALCVSDPSILNGVFLNLPGLQVDSANYAPYLARMLDPHHNKPGLDYEDVSVKRPVYSSIIAGRAIEVGRSHRA